MRFHLLNPKLIADQKRFKLYFRFELRIDAAYHSQIEAIEIIAHHDGYERKTVIRYEGERQYEAFVQYGNGIAFDEIEVSLTHCNGGVLASPQFFYPTKRPEIPMFHRNARPEAETV